MKKILPVLVVGFLILSGFGVVGINLNNNNYRENEKETNIDYKSLSFEETILISKPNIVHDNGFVNLEVKESFTKHLASLFTYVAKEKVHGYVWKCVKYLRDNDLENFFETLRIFFANVPYDIQLKHEKYYQTIFYVIFTLIGLKVEAEVCTNVGRIDAVIRMQNGRWKEESGKRKEDRRKDLYF